MKRGSDDSQEHRILFFCTELLSRELEQIGKFVSEIEMFFKL